MATTNTATATTSTLTSGDCIVNSNGQTMSVRRVAQAVSNRHAVVFVTTQNGVEKSFGALLTASWTVTLDSPSAQVTR